MPGHRIAKERFKNEELYDKYSCLSCGYLLRNAVQSAQCGHWFCESCIALLLKTSNPLCPNCHESLKSDEDAEGTPGYFPDRFVRRDINALEITCVYQPEGCVWEGTFSKLEGHLSECEYSVCGTCQQRLSTEPSEHKCTLKEEGFFCPYVKLGCNAGKFGSRQEVEAHVKDAELSHGELLATRISKLTISLEAVNQNAPSSRPQQQQQQQQHQQYVSTVEADGYTEPAYDSGICFGSGAERDNVPIKKSAPSPKSPHSSGAGIGTLSAGMPPTSALHHGQGEESVAKLKQEVDSVRREMKSKDDEIASLRTMVNKLERTQRSKNADFEDRDFRLSLIENSNYDGSMVWKIPQFSQRMSDAKSGKYTSIFSLPFYTGRYGYKMCLRLYILGDGIGKGSYMSLFFVLMKGEFDNILKWPFQHKVTFKLLNQGTGRDVTDTFQPDPMSTSFRKPRSDMNIASGCPRFVSHDDLKSNGFIEDDTIFIKCMVDTSTIRHP